MLRTPFYQYHLDQGARMVEFAGWEMPMVYTSIIEEHQQVRNSGGMFDVSHMARVYFTGPDAQRLLERLCTRRIHDLAHGQCRYSLVCNEKGGVRDDVLVYRFGDEEYMLVINAANRGKLWDHVHSHTENLRVKIDDRTEKTAMIAMQGPRVMDLIGRFSDEVTALKKYRFCVKSMLMFKATISRTGYTGEDGVEVILPGNMAAMAMKLMMQQGGDASDLIKPAGLGARDTLRLEAGMPLYGHEMDEETDPISAGLLFGINLDKHEHELGERFIGQDALEKINQDGPVNKLVGLFPEGKRTARQGMEIKMNGSTIGRITSGGVSPTLGRPIAMGYVPAEFAQPGTAIEIDLGKQTIGAKVTPLPFYKRPAAVKK